MSQRVDKNATVIQGTFIGGQPRIPLRPPMQGLSHNSLPGLPLQAKAGHQSAFPIQTLPPSGPGQPLPDEVKTKMEMALSANFSNVRVHVGQQAPLIGALAYTHGSDIYFAPGQYNPKTYYGQQLLGHELTHVLQQRAGRVRSPFGSGVAVVLDPVMEAEAENMGRRAAAYQVPVQAKRAAILAAAAMPDHLGAMQAKIPQVIQRMKRLQELKSGVGSSQISQKALKKVKARKYATQYAARWFFDRGFTNPGQWAKEAIEEIIAKYGEFSAEDFDRADHIALTESYLMMMYELD